MSQINQFAISQVLGTKMRPVKSSRFGGFGLLETTAEIHRASEQTASPVSGSEFPYDHDRVVWQVFEQVRDGASPDALLWNRQLQRDFCQRCRELGLDFPDAILNRRLLNIRKNKQRYAKQGICLSPTLKSEPHPSIVPQFAHVVEFALVRLKYRYGVSIDDILLDPGLSDQYERLALDIAQQLSPQDLRLGALYLRKSRFMKKSDQSQLTDLDVSLIDKVTTTPQPLSAVHVNEVPDSPGLIELKEGERYLYVARNEHLRPAVEQFATGHAFAIVASGFWQPNMDTITLQYAVGNRIAGVGVAKWELRLIHDRCPVFNWPVHRLAA